MPTCKWNLKNRQRNSAPVSTHKGLYRCNRLPFGVSSAPALWQRTMELILQGIPKTQCLLDDISRLSEEEHFHILEQVLERLERHNLAINMDKCAFFQTSLEFCVWCKLYAIHNY